MYRTDRVERLGEFEFQKDCYEIVSSEHNRDVVFMNSHDIVSSGLNRDVVYMNSQQLWLPTQYLHKIMPVNIPSWMRKGS